MDPLATYWLPGTASKGFVRRVDHLPNIHLTLHYRYDIFDGHYSWSWGSCLVGRPLQGRIAVPEVDKEFWTERAHLLRVMAHPVRLMILETLSESSRCVKDLNSLVPVSQPHLSQHMAALRRAELVDCHSSGNLRCYYLLQPTLVQRLIRLLAREHPVRFRDRTRVVQEARSRIGVRKNNGIKVARRPKAAARR